MPARPGRLVCQAALLALISSGASAGEAQMRWLTLDDELLLPDALLEIHVNSQHVSEFSRVLKLGTHYYARAADLAVWRLQPTGNPLVQGGETYYPLDAWQLRFIPATQVLDIDAPASDFAAQRFDLRAVPGQVPQAEYPSATGLALDYDLSLQAGNARSQAAALLDANLFGVAGAGVLRNRALLNNGNDTPGLLRLETSWHYEDVARLRSYNLGDSLTCAGEIGSAAHFAGVQVQRDFGLRPDLVTFPLPSVDGRASLPSGVDLLVNGRPTGSVTVEPGPFRLDNPPTLSGAGEITVVQRDLLGREQVLSVPYYSSPQLLRRGLIDYCAEAGALRQNYGLSSGDYGESFAAYSLRYGLNDTLTALLRLEGGESTRSLNLGAHWLVGHLGVFSTQAASSMSEQGAGRYAQLHLERQARDVSLAASVERATADFRRLGSGPLPALRSSVFAGTTVDRATLSAGVVWQRQQDDSRLRLYTFNLSYPLAVNWFANFNVQHQNTQSMLLLTLVHSFGLQGSLALSAQAAGSAGQYEGQASVQAQQTEPLEGGLGWQVYASAGQVRRQQAGVSWLGDGGRFALEAAHDDSLNSNASALRLSGRGGLVWLNESAQVTRGLGDGSMALVVVPGLAGVPVYAQHRQVAVTDSEGRAWVNALLPHQNNVLGIAASDLPLDVQLDSEEIVVRPPARSAVRVSFPVRRTQAALLTVVDAQQQAIPVGARAHLTGATQAFPFGRHGTVYLEGLAVHNRLEVQWAGHHCALEFEVPAGSNPQPEIGPLACKDSI